jgi:hypothetical protein
MLAQNEGCCPCNIPGPSRGQVKRRPGTDRVAEAEWKTGLHEAFRLGSVDAWTATCRMLSRSLRNRKLCG